MHITVNTPNGTIGRHLTKRLLEADASVTIVSRNPDKVADLVESGARLVTGSIDDETVIDRAFEGADALFWLTPPAFRPDFRDWGQAIAEGAAAAVKRHGISRTVLLSSVGAQHGQGTGPVDATHRAEQAFKAVDNVVTLRVGFFMENFLRDVATLKSDGVFYNPVPADKPLPHVATRDIAQQAYARLWDDTWTGHIIQGVHGPEDLTFSQAAERLSVGLGRPIQHVQITLAQLKGTLESLGMPDFSVDMFVEMYDGIINGRLDPAESRTEDTTTPTTLVDFAKTVLAPALSA